MRPPPKTYDFWVKVVEMLQQNWATIEGDETGARILFVADTSEIFDEMAFPSKTEAVAGLIYNGFRRFADAPDLQHFLRAPEPSFVDGQFTNDIYSSGRFWRDAPV